MPIRLGLGLGLLPASSTAVPTAPPVNVTPPSIPAPLTQGQTLTANPGAWTGTPGGSYGYQWQRWNGSSWGNISGATNQTYVAQAADVSAGTNGLRVQVTATNIIGSTTANSAAVTIAAPLSISGTPGAAAVGSGYTFTPSVSGGHATYSFALTGSLPAGLNFSTSTGAISGTPTSSGTASGLNITVTDADGLTASLGAFSITVSSGVTFVAENRPSTVAMTTPTVTSGDSMEVGVGAQSTSQSWSGQLAGKLSSGTITRRGQGGMAFKTPAAGINTNPITTQITGQGSPGLGYPQMFDGGVNDTDQSVNPEPGAQNWLAHVQTTAIPAIVAALTGGSSQLWTFFNMTQGGYQSPGCLGFADWVKLHRALTATYGAKIVNTRRALMETVTSNTSDVDNINVNRFWDLPLSYRGNTSAFAKTTETVLNTCSSSTTNPTGINSVAPASGYAEGAYMLNIHANASIGNNLCRKIGASGGGTWEQVDMLHPSRWGYEAWMGIAFDILCAFKGTGAPFAPPAELFCKQDDASNTVVGTIYYIGAAPASAALFDRAGTAITTLSLTDNGSTNGYGSITVRRSATGTLTEGEQQLVLQLTSAGGGVLHTAVDFRIGEPSTQTIPRLWNIPRGSTSTDCDFSMAGLQAHGLADDNKFFFVCWVEPAALGGSLAYLGVQQGRSSPSNLQISMNGGGGLGVNAQDNANTLIYNTNAGTPFAVGVRTWLAIDLDLSVATPTIRGYYNRSDGGGADVAISANGASGPTSLLLSKSLSLFFSFRGASQATDKFTTTDVNRNQFRGKFGNIIVGNGNIGINGAPSVARLLWNLDGSPVARAPYSTINGRRPVWDIRGGIGDFLNGGYDLNEPVFGTYHRIKGLT